MSPQFLPKCPQFIWLLLNYVISAFHLQLHAHAVADCTWTLRESMQYLVASICLLCRQTPCYSSSNRRYCFIMSESSLWRSHMTCSCPNYLELPSGLNPFIWWLIQSVHSGGTYIKVKTHIFPAAFNGPKRQTPAPPIHLIHVTSGALKINVFTY